MDVILAGIDEAGYGPLLGPLMVGMSVFRVRDWPRGDQPADSTPNLWTLLSKGVCREPGRGGKSDAKGRIAIADSKQLKLSNSVKSTHPLIHLERGVLSLARSISGDGRIDATQASLTDRTLFDSLGARGTPHECYGTPDFALPVAVHAGELSIACNTVSRTLIEAGVECLRIACRAVGEDEFNRIIRTERNKAATTMTAIGEHLRSVWDTFARSGDRVGIVCDRLGGRASYAGLLQEALRATVDIIEESDTRSRYIVRDGARRMGVAFMVESETAHLPVALASMTAKYTRELAMARFNRFWSARFVEVRGREIAPTAGYALDARRWLHEIGDVMPAKDRKELIRIA